MPGFEIFGDEERREVQDVLDTGVLFRYGFDGARKGHWKARTLEDELCKRLGTAHCHVCSSGTSALGIALAACGIGAGDEVIVPPFTFIATIESVLQCGAVPIFAEVDDTLCLDPEAVTRAITPKTRAVVPVHMCGSMARVDELARVCCDHGLTMIEDTAQAIGASFEGKMAGTFGRMGCFSFDAVKTITCGEGGAVITDDRELYDRAHQYADHGHDHIGNDRGAEGHPILGTNHRISELNAAVGLAQLRKLDRILDTQRSHKRALREALATSADVSFRAIPDSAGDSATFLTFFMPDEARAREVAAALPAAGFDGAFYWYDNNWHYTRGWPHLAAMATPGRSPLELLDGVPDYGTLELPQSDHWVGRAISLLVKLGWTPEELDRRCGILARAVES